MVSHLAHPCHSDAVLDLEPSSDVGMDAGMRVEAFGDDQGIVTLPDWARMLVGAGEACPFVPFEPSVLEETPSGQHVSEESQTSSD